MSEQSIQWAEGWRSHQDGLDDENPYDRQRQLWSHTQWQSGWCARFTAIKHGFALTYDDNQVYW